jgi:predicted RNase H-like nuclease (RuvC/YqgF family)
LGDDVYQNPEVYFDESERQLSKKQEEDIAIYKMRIEKTKKEIERLEEIMDDENEEEIQSKVDELNDLMTEYEDEIESIQDDPDGEFPDDLIEEKVDELADDVRRDPESFLNEHGIDWEQFIDKDNFIQGVIDADGFGHTLNSYDGNADETKIQDQWFYVMRID